MRRTTQLKTAVWLLPMIAFLSFSAAAQTCPPRPNASIRLTNNDLCGDDPSVFWNGKRGENPLDTGVFVWLVEVELIDGTTEILTGDLTLMK